MKAFSLLECLIVLSIISITAYQAIPLYSSWSQSMQSHLEGQAWLHALQVARQAAILQGTPHCLQNANVHTDLALNQQQICFYADGGTHHQAGSFWGCEKSTKNTAWAISISTIGHLHWIEEESNLKRFSC